MRANNNTCSSQHRQVNNGFFTDRARVTIACQSLAILVFIISAIIVLYICIIWKPEENDSSNCTHIQETKSVCSSENISSIVSSQPNSSICRIHESNNPDYCVDTLPRFCECGHPETDIFVFGKRRKRIVGGQPVCNRNYYPWMAQILFSGEGVKTGKEVQTHNCGATVISKRFLLTTAHCVKCFIVTEVELRNRRRMEVDRVIIHPDYQRNCSPNEKESQPHDIALVRLKDEVNVEPICLPLLRCHGMTSTDLNMRDNKKGFTAGYGFRPSLLDESPAASEDLHHVSLDVVDGPECMAIYNHERVVVNSSNMICAGGGELTGDSTCDGDSGGPLFTTFNSRSVQIGVAAFGSKKCGDEFPSVFTKVTMYMRWIINETANLT